MTDDPTLLSDLRAVEIMLSRCLAIADRHEDFVLGAIISEAHATVAARLVADET